MTRISLVVVFLSLLSLCAATIPTFCKCTCFTNSTIIELGPASDNHPSLRLRSPLHDTVVVDKRAASASCDQCNRDFCLKKYNLPICRDAEDKDVSTQCFQRDSVKDRVIVWGFILGTAGLLGWAGLKGVMERQGVVGAGAGGGRGR
ncbi:putative MFS transporter [Podospora conica]|nr:putative MFS transporter [Schizothecium conicum]